jgi:hypothetical protein
MARLLQPALQQSLGATIVVENRPAASASIGATVVAKSPPDGSTWLLTSDTFGVSTLLLNNLPSGSFPSGRASSATTTSRPARECRRSAGVLACARSR